MQFLRENQIIQWVNVMACSVLLEKNTCSFHRSSLTAFADMFGLPYCFRIGKNWELEIDTAGVILKHCRIDTAVAGGYMDFHTTPLRQSETIAEAINKAYPQFRATGINDPHFAKLPEDTAIPECAVRQFSLHSKDAYEIPIPGTGKYVIKVYPDDGYKAAIVLPTESMGHKLEGMNYVLSGGTTFNYLHAMDYLESN